MQKADNIKSSIIILMVALIAIISIVFANYVEYRNKKNEIKKFNDEFTIYENSEVQINTLITLMNRAIEENKKNNITQDEQNMFLENDENSIKVFLEIKSRGSMIPMEDLILGEKAGIEKVSYAFSDMNFKITNIEYHQKTGQVKKIIFTAIEDEVNIETNE